MSQSHFFPVTHSVLSADALLQEVSMHYTIEQPIECRLLSRKMNDVYLIVTARGPYILRVYRTPWRSREEILYELDFLQFLDRQGVTVAKPLPRRDGKITDSLSAPEGHRNIVLFTYAVGRPLQLNEVDSHDFGMVIALMHNAADHFVSHHHRPSLDLRQLVDEPLRAIQPFLHNRVEDWQFLNRVARLLHTRLSRLNAEGLDQSVCHGDVYDGNAHRDDEGQITLFDFDLCGPGWRVYDLAVYRSTLDFAGADQQVWAAFLDGYREWRQLAKCDLEAIPLLVLARRIWHMGNQVANASDWGTGSLAGYFDNRALPNIRLWMQNHINDEE